MKEDGVGDETAGVAWGWRWSEAERQDEAASSGDRGSAPRRAGDYAL